MNYKYILFDLDGTLTDPKVCITKSVHYALAKYDIKDVELCELEKFIGPPLKDSFVEFYSFEEQAAIQAIEYYREYFKDKGIFENKVYNGICDLLGDLKNRDLLIGIATSKPTVFAKKIIEYFDMTQYFDIIVGSNLDGTRVRKADVIKYAIDELSLNKLEDVIMIGDRKHDVIGAQENNIDSIGVLYGYGTKEELEAAKPTYIVNSVSELHKLLVTN